MIGRRTIRWTLRLGALAGIAAVVWVLVDDARNDASLNAALGPARSTEGSSVPTPRVRLADQLKPTLSASRQQPAVAPPPSSPERPASESSGPGRAAERQRPVTVSLYQHATHDVEFPGHRWIVGDGPAEAGRSFVDDEISAVEVPEGWTVTLFDGRGESGARTTVGAGLHNLAPYRFNDRASSLRVSRATRVPNELGAGAPGAVCLYENLVRVGGDPGHVWTLSIAPQDVTALHAAGTGAFESDAASAVWVPVGLEVTLFDEPDGRGPALVLGPGFHELEVQGFNDRTSSVRIRRADEDD